MPKESPSDERGQAAPNRPCVFVSDLHGNVRKYEKLFHLLATSCPSGLFLGGDLLPHTLEGDFLDEYLIPSFLELRSKMDANYPSVFLILGNDDPRSFESRVMEAEQAGIWHYIHGRPCPFAETTIYGYACVPPTPFRLKDWERYDVSRFCDLGCISPEEGVRTTPVNGSDLKWGTIQSDIENLVSTSPLDKSVFLFHAPPYDTPLDRAALEGKQFDHAPLDTHVGSIAIRKFIESRQPLLTLHGHVHESARLTGQWKTIIGDTLCLSAAHDGPELAAITFDLGLPLNAVRQLI